MHQIKFRLGLCPRPRWESLQRSPDLLAEFKGPTSKERQGRGGVEKAGREGNRVKGKGGTPWFLFTPPDVKSSIKPCVCLSVCLTVCLSVSKITKKRVHAWTSS